MKNSNNKNYEKRQKFMSKYLVEIFLLMKKLNLNLSTLLPKIIIKSLRKTLPNLNL